MAGYGGALHELDGPPGGLRPTIGHPRGESAGHRVDGLGHHRADALGHHRPETLGHRGERPDTEHAAPVAYPYPDGCGSWQQADVRTARDRLGWRPRIALEESLADIWMEAACRI